MRPASPLKRPSFLTAVLLAVALLTGRAAADELAGNGTFRFLTASLPVGSTNAEYLARIVTVNADGPVTFSASNLPPGMVLDPLTGFLTGRPTSTYNQDITLTADDGSAPIQFIVGMSVNASGGGGNEGSTITNTSLAAGRIGSPYSEAISIENGVGPYIFGAVSLPPGLSMNGLTGEISGSPLSAGTYYTRLTIIDTGESNKVVTVLPLTVLPLNSDFQLTTSVTNNGEVGTPFCDTWTTSGSVGSVSFSASGLPPGLGIDAATGVVSGTPTQAGTFRMIISATDNQDTISSELSMIVVPGPGSGFHWNFFGVPTAIVNETYDRQPPILVEAQNGTTVTYSAVGLPEGILYNPQSGELTGTAIEIGEYPILFTATDTTTSEVLSLTVDFLVLPPTGGDSNSLPVNLWVVRQKLKTGNSGKDLWSGSVIYNADRRAGAAFDPATEALELSIGTRTIQVDPGMLSGPAAKLAYKSESGTTPVEVVKLSPRLQTIRWVSKKDDITDTVPGILRHMTTLGDRSYRLDAFFNSKGIFKPALDYRRTSFVVQDGLLLRKSSGSHSARLVLLLGDPTFSYEEGLSTLRLRLLQAGEVLIDKDFTALAQAKTSTHKPTGATVYVLKGLKDQAATDRLAKFSYKSLNGRMLIKLSDVDLSALLPDETHLAVELSVDDKIYYTSVTLFDGGKGKYTTRMP